MSFDVFRNAPTDLFERSTTGGYLTIIVILVAEVLAISEFMWFMNTSYEEKLGVGKAFNDKIDLYIDMTMNFVPCDQAQVQLWDKYQNKPVPIAGSSFHMTRVINGEKQEQEPSRNYDLHKNDEHYLAKSLFEHPELERDWDKADPTFNENSFVKTLDSHDLTFVFYYVGWCPHCRAFHPKWQKFVEQLDETDVKDGDGNVLKIATIRINCVPFENLCWDKDVHDYPHLRLHTRSEKNYQIYKKKKEDKIDGDYETPDLIRFITTAAEKTHHKDVWIPERQQEGCHLKGLLRLPRVPGFLQFSKRGKGHSVGWADLSHEIKSYTFLDPHDDVSVGTTGLETNPLDGKKFTAPDKRTAFSHHATLVQTTLDQKYYGMRYVYQMSVLSVQSAINEKKKLSIRFGHEMFPMALEYVRTSQTFGHFLMRICAIIGGLYSIFYHTFETGANLKSD